MEKSERHIIKQFSFSVPQNTENSADLETTWGWVEHDDRNVIFMWTIPITSQPDLI